MKKLLFKTTLVILVSILYVLTANAQTNSTLENQVSVYPVNPTAKDSVYLNFSYVSNDGCPDYYLVIDSIVNNKIYVNKKVIISDRACTMVISKFVAKINLGIIIKNTPIYFEGKLMKTIIPQCTMDKSGIVVKGTNACEGQLFIQENSPLAVIQLYRFENKAISSTTNTLSGLQAGDKVRFAGNIIKNDSLARLCNIVGFATCWEKVIEPVPCVMDRKGEVTGLTANSSILKDLNTQDLFEISNIKLVVGSIIQFKGVKVVCKTTPCYNIVECYKIISIPPPPPCVMDKKGVVVAGKDIYAGRLFIQEISPISSYIPLYAIQANNTSNLKPLKVGDEVKFGGYLQRNDSAASTIYPLKIVGVATCWEILSVIPPCVMDRKGEIIKYTENSSIVKDATSGQIFEISGVKLAIGTVITFKGNLIQCITTPCYNIVECYKIISTPPAPCVLDKMGVVVEGTGECKGQLFIEVYTTAAIALKQLYTFKNNSINAAGTVSSALKPGDKVKFGGYLVKNDSNTVRLCNIIGVATCWEIISVTPPCVMDRKGEIVKYTENSSIVKDITSGQIFEISGVKLAIGTVITFKGNLIQCITTPCYNIVECYKIISTPPVPCVLDKKGVVVEGIGECKGQLFIEEFSIAATAIKQLYTFKNNSINADGSVSSVLKPGDKVKFGGNLVKNDSNTVRLCNIIGVATCWEVIKDSVTCIKDRKGVIIEYADNSSIVKDMTTGEIFAIRDVKLAIQTVILFKGVKIECVTKPCYNIVECYQVVSAPPTPCVLDKNGVVVEGTGECKGQLFIEVYSPAAIALKQLYSFKNNSINAAGTVSSVLKPGDKVKFGGYLVKNDSNTVRLCNIIGVATCWEIISAIPPCIMDRKGEIIKYTENSSIVKDITSGQIFEISGVKLAIGTVITFKGNLIQCITTPCYNIVECYKIVTSPPAPCVMDKKGVVIEGIGECKGQLFIQMDSPISAYKILYAIQGNEVSNSTRLKVGDVVKFGGYAVKNDSNAVRLCNMTGIATCWEVISDAVTCVKDRKGVVTKLTESASIVKDLSTSEIFAINGVKLAVGTTILFKGVKIVCVTTPCYNIVECYDIINTPPVQCIMDKVGVVVPGIDGCTGRLFIKQVAEPNTNPQLYEIQNYIATSSDGATMSKLQAGDKVKFGGYLTRNDSTKSILCYTVGVATCFELIAAESTYTLAGKAMAGKELMKSGLAVLFKKGDGKAIASNNIVDGKFTFTNLPEAAYTVYVIPDINIYKNYLPTFYINKFIYNQADYIKLYQDVKEITIYLRNINMQVGDGRISGNIFFETDQLKDSILAANGNAKSFDNPNRKAENTTVVLFDNTNQPVAWTITDEFGNYSFENLALSTYRIVSETGSAKAEATVDLSAESSDANADLMLRSPEEKTGLNLIEELVLDFYPNPVIDKLTINLKEDQQISIFNALGQLLINRSLYSGVNILDVSSINKGVYFAKIGNSTFRMIKK